MAEVRRWASVISVVNEMKCPFIGLSLNKDRVRLSKLQMLLPFKDLLNQKDIQVSNPVLIIFYISVVLLKVNKHKVNVEKLNNRS